MTQDPATPSADAPASPRTVVTTALAFATVGLALYGGLYAGSEALIARHGVRNRFFMVANAPLPKYDYVILGASHAGVLDYRQMNDALEQALGGRVINLSMVGAGPVVNRLALDYFLAGHDAATVVYLVDSFAFYKADWNEDRLADARLFQRAPFDPALVRALVASPAPLETKVGYVSGFLKINNHDRFGSDLREEEGSRFERTYRPVPQIDEQRLAYLYPPAIDEAVRQRRDRYLGELEAMIATVQARGGRFVAVRPPIPDRILTRLPGEAEFDTVLAERLARAGVELHDLSRVDNDPALFYDSDHLNQAGTQKLIAQLASRLTTRHSHDR